MTSWRPTQSTSPPAHRIGPSTIAYYRRNTEEAYSRQRGPLRSSCVLDSDHGEGLCIRVPDASGPRRPTPSARHTLHGAHSNRSSSEASSGALAPSQASTMAFNCPVQRAAHLCGASRSTSCMLITSRAEAALHAHVPQRHTKTDTDTEIFNPPKYSIPESHAAHMPSR